MNSNVDNHFNIFYSYNSGNLDNLSSLKQLEDNITRSFLIVLSNLNKKNQSFLLSKVTSNNLEGKFKYLMQNKNFSEQKEILQNNKIKILITISTEKAHVVKGDLTFEDNNLLEKIGKLDDTDKKDLVKEIRDYFQSDNKKDRKLNKLDVILKHDDAETLYELIHDSRPDALIYNEQISILLESKINFCKQSREQLFRHLTNNNGFNIPIQEVRKGEECGLYSLVNTTWSEVCNDLKSLEELSETEKFLINQWEEYIIMCGEKVSLDYLIEKRSDKNDSTQNFRKNQLNLICSKLENTATLKRLEFIRNRCKIDSNTWQKFGELEGLHFAVFIDDNEVGVTLTIRDKVINKLIKQHWDDYFHKLYTNCLRLGIQDEKLCHRLKIKCTAIHKFENTQSAQKGCEDREEFKTELSMEWVRRKFTKNGIINEDELKDFIMSSMKYAKQSEIMYSIPYPDLNEYNRRVNEVERKQRCGESSAISYERYEMDLNDLRNSDCLIRCFEDFFIKMEPVYDFIKEVTLKEKRT